MGIVDRFTMFATARPDPGTRSTSPEARIVRRLAGRWPAVVTALVVAPIALVTALGTAYWPGRTFPGFFLMENDVVPTIGLYSWTGLAAGVPFHGRVTAVDGQAVRRNAEVYDAVAAKPVGTPVRYTIVHEERTLERTVPSMRFGARDYWLTVGLFLAFGVLAAGACVLVAVLKPGSPAALAFLVQGAVTSVFALTGTALYHPRLAWLSPLHLAAQAAMPASFIHLGLAFPVARPAVTTRPAWLAIPYGASAVLALGVFRDFYAATPGTAVLHVIYVYSALAIACMIGLVAWAYWENRTPEVRPQLHAVLPGLAIGTGVGLYAYLNGARGGGDFPMNFMALTPFLFYLSVGWAIARHDLFGIDRLLKQAVVYGTLTILLTGAYAIGVAVAHELVPEPTAGARRALALVVVVAIAAAFDPLRRGVQGVVDRTFYRSRVDYRATVRELSSALTSLLDLDDILARVGRTLVEGLQIEGLQVILWLEPASRVWRWTGGAMRAEPDARYDGLRAWLEAAPPAPRRVPDPASEPGAPWEELRALGAAMVVPLVAGGRPLGALVLGPKRSGRRFDREETELLGTLGAQSAIAVQNALSYAALEASNVALERKVRERTAQLVQAEKMASLGVLVAGVAHEINNPVTFIAGSIEPLRETLEDLRRTPEAQAGVERVLEMVDVIGRGAERTAAIVRDLRAFSRLGLGDPEPVDVHEAIEVSLRLLRPRWERRVEVHRAYGMLPRVDAVPGQLNQVFMNLLANACEAIPGTGNVWIETACDGDTARVVVRDDGPGIAPAALPRLFEPFFTTKPQGAGTGLGLSISHGIVTAHGGTITVDAPPGRGAAFTVTLPVRQRARTS